jgi:predicted Zn-dependent protease
MMRRARPRSLLAPDRFLSSEGCRDLLQRIIALGSGGGDTQVSVRSRWTGNVRWSRNQVTSCGDTTQHFITIARYIRGASAMASTNRIDNDSLRDCIRRAETMLRYRSINIDAPPLRRAEKYLETNVWSDATFKMDAALRGDVQQRMSEPAVLAGLLSHGYLETAAIGNGVMNSAGLFAYQPQTRAELSMTVRNAKGTSSGWAGTQSVDWQKIDADMIAARAIEKCKAATDPVAVEPGRYTVILEPQAVADLTAPLVRSFLRIAAEGGLGPWAERAEPPVEATPVLPVDPEAPRAPQAGGGRGSRLGKRVLDPRISISANPADIDAPFVPFSRDGLPYKSVEWIENGILRNLAYDRQYALRQLNRPDPLGNSGSFRMSGGNTSLQEMIASTGRGFLITRFINVREVIDDSLLCTGNTSDGMWLIEGGKITHAAKNFRFRDSPLFAFNNVMALGVPERVLLDVNAICPPIKVREFSLTSLADAV